MTTVSLQLKQLAEKEFEDMQQHISNSLQRFILQTLITLKNGLQDLICYLRKKWDLPKPIPQVESKTNND